MVKFDATREETAAILGIARRAVRKAAQWGVQYDVQTAAMDIEATHCNGCLLRLHDLLAAGDVDFAHDVFGIRRHLNRETGTLEGCFLPRFAEDRG